MRQELLEQARSLASAVPPLQDEAKDAKLSLHAVLFPVPVPTGARVIVIDENFRKKGDVNRDGVVDDADLDILTEAFGSSPGDPKWDAEYDLNDDGIVDMRDIATAVRNYGSKAPEHTTSCEVDVAPGKCALIAESSEQILDTSLTATKNETTTVFFIYDYPLGLMSRALVPPTPPLPLPMVPS